MRYFKRSEFKCPCCGQEKMDEEFLEKIDEARHIARCSFRINSGYRCRKHNKEVGGVDDSEHTQGEGADIDAPDSSTRYRIIGGLLSAGFNRIGVGKDFVHAGTAMDKPQHVIWTYYTEE